MPFPNTDTQFKPGESGNPNGKPKGTIHLSTMIQNMLNEPTEPDDVNPKGQSKTKMQAIIATAVLKANSGDNKWAEWLAKYGYGQKFEVEHSGDIETRKLSDDELNKKIQSYLKRTQK